MEEKRIELVRQLERDKLAHQEGNVLLRELAEKKSQLSEKINTIHNEVSTHPRRATESLLPPICSLLRLSHD